VIHEVVQSTLDCNKSERSSWNTPDVDHIHVSIVLYGLVDEIRVPRVTLQ
jgi:hypothetical protein